MNYFYFPDYFPSNSILTVMDYFYFPGYFPRKITWKIKKK
jgi:hypothetical protein